MDYKTIKPKDVANKSSKENFKKAIRMAIELESEAVRRNTNTFNQNRYTAVADIDDYDALKDKARAIKEESIANIPQLIEELKEQITKRGGHFYLAKDAADANEYIKKVCLKHNAELVVKAKSMTSEETKLNRVLQDAGIEVAETDLAEFILQVADEQPSHIVAPAIHRTRERIAQLFKEKFNPQQPLETGEELTVFARSWLRKKFLNADVGISGANLIAADTGTIVLVESEGNIRMTTTLPPVHIALAGVEKIIKKRADIPNFIELLAPSGTGQPLTSYTNILRPPLKLPVYDFKGGRKAKEREFHLVLLDNGRMVMRDDPVIKEALYCIRCSACLNVCTNFQTLGGHAFGGETYSGGIGSVWEAGTSRLENARFADLCTGCSRCIDQCPVRIDIPWLTENIRARMNVMQEDFAASFLSQFMPTAKEDRNSSLQKQFFANYYVFARLGAMLAPFSNWISSSGLTRRMMSMFFSVDERRKLPQFQKETLIAQYKKMSGDINE